jgi:SulP family sulfate permease
MIGEANRRKARGGSFHVQSKTPKAISRFDKFHVPEQLPGGHTHVSKHDAIREMVSALDKSICATCTARIFRECPTAPADPEAADASGEPTATKSPAAE